MSAVAVGYRGRSACLGQTLLGLVVALLVAAQGHTLAVAADSASGQSVFESALQRNRDAETLRVLTAEGQILYQRELIKLDGYRYCSQAVAEAERGALRESIKSASKALHIGQEQGNEDLIALSKRDLAIAYSYAGDLDRAEQYARQALEHTARNPQIVAGPALKILGDIAQRRGRFAEAVGVYEQAYEAASERFRPLVRLSLVNAHLAAGDVPRSRALFDMAGEPSPVLLPMQRRTLGNLLLAEGKPAQARQTFERIAEIGGSDAAYHKLWALEGIARSALALGDTAAALEGFAAAAGQSELIRARFRSEEFKAGLFGDVQEIFERAISMAADAGDMVRAWELSERSRSRALLDSVRGRVDIESEATDAVALDALSKALRDEEVLLQFHSLEDRLLAWVVRRNGVVGHSLPVPLRMLSADVEAFRASMFERKDSTLTMARALYDKIIAPLALPAGGALIVVPHGGLHYLPFQALRSDEGYLIEQYPLAIAPSASVALQLISDVQQRSGQFVAFGNPANNEREELPGAEREVRRISELFPQRNVFYRSEATKSRFRESAGAGRIVHVAAHAEVDSVDPLHSRILFAAEGTDRGYLEAREVYDIDLAGVSLVTLSACESGLGRIAKGDEIQGFTRAFLRAGASGLIVSLWPVADDSTELLMTTLYRELAAGASAIDAMRSGQRAVIAREALSHPFFWAPFNLIGNWRLHAGSTTR